MTRDDHERHHKHGPSSDPYDVAQRALRSDPTCDGCGHAAHWRECRAEGCYCQRRGPSRKPDPGRLFDTDRDTLLEFLAWCNQTPETWITLDGDESRYAVNRFLADYGIACDDFAPDTLAPDPADRDVCTTCHFRKADHGR